MVWRVVRGVGIAALIVLVLLAWAAVGLLPLWVTDWAPVTAGVIGDSFGVSTSFFTSVGFLAAMWALLLQIKESRESGIRQLRQDELQAEEVRLQTKQVELQAEQAKAEQRAAEILQRTAEIAQRTSELQDSIRRDGQRQLVIGIVQSIYASALRFQRALEEYALVYHSPSRKDERGSASRHLDEAETELLSGALGLDLQFGEDKTTLAVNAINTIATLRSEWVKTPVDKLHEKCGVRIQELQEALEPLWRQAAS